MKICRILNKAFRITGHGAVGMNENKEFGYPKWLRVFFLSGSQNPSNPLKQKPADFYLVCHDAEELLQTQLKWERNKSLSNCSF